MSTSRKPAEVPHSFSSGERRTLERDRAVRGCPVEEERILPDAGHEEIGAAVAVDIARGEAHRVDIRQERFVDRDALELDRAAELGGVAVDADAALSRGRIALGGFERLALREDEVERAVAVEVDDRDAAAEALWQQLAATGARFVGEVDACLCRDIAERDARQRADRGRRRLRRRRDGRARAGSGRGARAEVEERPEDDREHREHRE